MEFYWGWICTQSLRDCRLRRLPRHLDIPKAFQTNTACSFGFFAPRLFTKASFRHSLETKKPLICMRGFVATIGASLEEFAEDVRAIFTPNLKNLH